MRKRAEAKSRPLRSALNVEGQHELGLLIKVVENLCSKIRPPLEPVFIRTLFAAMISTALERFYPDRRMSYLEQWNHFLSWLPESVANRAEDERPYVLIKSIEQFQLEDRRGKRKPGPPFPSGAN